VGDPVVVGSGLSTGGAVVCDALGEADPVGVTEPLGVADGLTDGDRDGEGVRDGLGTVRVGLSGEVGEELGWTPDWPVLADSDAGTGRNRMYSASTARNRLEMTRVEVRGRPLTRHPRSPGRYRVRPRC
jgi:hypothetical protein